MSKQDTLAAAAVITQAMESREGTTQDDIAGRIGVQPAQFWQWKAGRRPVPAMWAELLAAELGVRPEDVSPAYRKQMELSAHVAASVPVEPQRRARGPEWVQVPFYPTAAVAAGGGAANQGSEKVTIPLLFRRESLERQGVNIERSFCVPVRGDSMEPYIEDGDVILCDQSQTAVIDGEIYVCRLDNGDGEEIVKRLYRLPGRRLRVESENKRHPTFEVDHEGGGLVVIGLVQWTAGWTRRTSAA